MRRELCCACVATFEKELSSRSSGAGAPQERTPPSRTAGRPIPPARWSAAALSPARGFVGRRSPGGRRDRRRRLPTAALLAPFSAASLPVACPSGRQSNGPHRPSRRPIGAQIDQMHVANMSPTNAVQSTAGSWLPSASPSAVIFSWKYCRKPKSRNYREHALNDKAVDNGFPYVPRAARSITVCP